jgi:hypothetical protein
MNRPGAAPERIANSGEHPCNQPHDVRPDLPDICSVSVLQGLLSGFIASAKGELYLLTFTAYPHHEQKERNLYDLTPSIQLISHYQGYGADIMITKKNDRYGVRVRYGVHAVVRVKVLNTSTSAKSPASARKSVYVLVYDPV